MRYTTFNEVLIHYVFSGRFQHLWYRVYFATSGDSAPMILNGLIYTLQWRHFILNIYLMMATLHFEYISYNGDTLFWICILQWRHFILNIYLTMKALYFENISYNSDTIFWIYILRWRHLILNVYLTMATGVWFYVVRVMGPPRQARWRHFISNIYLTMATLYFRYTSYNGDTFFLIYTLQWRHFILNIYLTSCFPAAYRRRK